MDTQQKLWCAIPLCCLGLFRYGNTGAWWCVWISWNFLCSPRYVFKTSRESRATKVQFYAANLLEALGGMLKGSHHIVAVESGQLSWFCLRKLIKETKKRQQREQSNIYMGKWRNFVCLMSRPRYLNNHSTLLCIYLKWHAGDCSKWSNSLSTWAPHGLYNSCQWCSAHVGAVWNWFRRVGSVSRHLEFHLNFPQISRVIERMRLRWLSLKACGAAGAGCSWGAAGLRVQKYLLERMQQPLYLLQFFWILLMVCKSCDVLS